MQPSQQVRSRVWAVLWPPCPRAFPVTLAKIDRQLPKIAVLHVLRNETWTRALWCVHFQIGQRDCRTSFHESICCCAPIIRDWEFAIPLPTSETRRAVDWTWRPDRFAKLWSLDAVGFRMKSFRGHGWSIHNSCFFSILVGLFCETDQR